MMFYQEKDFWGMDYPEMVQFIQKQMYYARTFGVGLTFQLSDAFWKNHENYFMSKPFISENFRVAMSRGGWTLLKMKRG